MANGGGIFGPTGREVFQNIQRERALQSQQLANQLAASGASIPTIIAARSGGLIGQGIQNLGELAAGTQDPRMERAMRSERAQAQLQLAAGRITRARDMGEAVLCVLLHLRVFFLIVRGRQIERHRL